MDKFLFAPFSAHQVQRLNEGQVHVAEGFPRHPFTCRNRGNGLHGTEGGDTGVLIATEQGWVCPHCDYRQDWAHQDMAADPAPRLLAFYQKIFHAQPEKVPLVEERLSAYRALVDLGMAGIDVMISCLERRLDELRGPGVLDL